MNALDHRQLASALMPAVLAAGACLLRHRAAGVSSERKADGSPVTAADRDAEAIITAALARADPSTPVIGEEAVAAGHVPSVTGSAFLVDALDGTREYVRGGDDFTVNVALVVDGTPAFGILLAPAAGRLFATLGPSRTAASRIEAHRLAEVGYQPVLTPVSTVEPDPSALRVLTSRSHRSAETDAFLADFNVARITGIGSSLKFGLIAAGEADMYPRFGPTSAWDTAAGHAILGAAGG
ncbi:MAG: 3'(2'),5'-bisphosphate nucleotidase CysQ, partial [Hyphomicrobiaceae bacterium]